MRNIWLVIKHEIRTTLQKRSFWLLTFLMPALLFFFNLYVVIQDSDSGDADEAATSEAEGSEAARPLTVGMVDESGLIAEIPEGIPPGLFVRFSDSASALSALEAGDVDQYILIAEDYLTSGDVAVYDSEFQILESGEGMGVAFNSEDEWVLPFLINYNLTGDASLVNTIRNPTPGVLAEYHAVSPREDSVADSDKTLAVVVAVVLPYVYYFILIISSGYMLQSVTAEKENRTVEVLLLSLRPREMMVGKILGLSVIVMIQILVWTGGGMLALGRTAQFLDVVNYDFPSGFLIWAVLFLVLGYLLYASAMSAAGAIANTAREGNQMTWILILPLLPTLMFSRQFLEQPHGTLSVILSLFPLSAPSAMVTRMALAAVPWWQVAISITGVALSAFLMVTLASRFFRPDNLLSGASFNWRRLARGWRA